MVECETWKHQKLQNMHFFFNQKLLGIIGANHILVESGLWFCPTHYTHKTIVVHVFFFLCRFKYIYLNYATYKIQNKSKNPIKSKAKAEIGFAVMIVVVIVFIAVNSDKMSLRCQYSYTID